MYLKLRKYCNFGAKDSQGASLKSKTYNKGGPFK